MTDYVSVTDPGNLAEAQARVRNALKRQGEAAARVPLSCASAPPVQRLQALPEPEVSIAKDQAPLTSDTPVKTIIASVAYGFGVSAR